MLTEKQISMIHEDCEKIIKGVGKDIYKLQGSALLITGANGMLASFFVDTVALLNKKYFDTPCKIIAIIRSELDENSRLWHLKCDENIEFVRQDVSQPFIIENKVDYIIHAASKASPKYYLSQPIDTINSNVIALKTLLEYSIKNNIKSFMYFSSAEIYGDPDETNIPTPETYEGRVLCTDPRACYTETKRFCETMLFNYAKQYNIPAKAVRPWHVFGLGMKLNDGRVLADFIRDGLNNKNIEILSDGLSTRSFCYMTDAHIVFWKILLSDYNGEVFNVGNDSKEMTIREVAELVCSLFNNKINYSYNKNGELKYLANSPRRCCPNMEKARRLLNYSSKDDIQDWLLRMINWYR